MTQDNKTEQAQQNGHKPGGRPGIANLLVGPETSDYFDLPRELLEGSPDFAKLLARGRFSEQEIAQLVRIMGTEDRYNTGSTDIHRLVWLKAVAKIGQDGKAREEAITALTGGQGWRASLTRPMNNIIDRARPNHPNDRQGPQL